MENHSKTREIFYFHPQNHGYNPDTIDEVHLIGEFNDWGKHLTPEYKLIKDKTKRWVGIFDVEEGKYEYKFLLNRNTYCPNLGYGNYSTAKTPDWAKNRIWYQIFPDRFFRGNDTPVTNLVPWDSKPNFFDNFGGTLKGITSKINYFNDLYGDLSSFAMYLNPLHLSTASNHKYWPEDFAKIDPQFGTEEDFQELIDTIHQKGGKLIIDLVYNHTGINHYAFMDILKNGPNSKYLDWYRELPNFEHEKIHLPCLSCAQGQPQNVTIEKISENEAVFSLWNGKYKFPLTNYKEEMTFDELNDSQPFYELVGDFSKPNYASWWGFFELPELNTYNEDVKKNLIDSAKKWITMGIDGFRLDVPNALNNAHGFWKEFRKELIKHSQKPDDIYIVGEVWTNDGINTSFLLSDHEGRPTRFDAIMNYPIREAVLNFYTGQILVHGMDRVSHDGEISTSQMDIEIHKNYAHLPFGISQVQMNCFSTHDTRRLRSVLSDDRKFKACLLMQFTLLGLPTVYYGDEIGTHGWIDPENRTGMRWDIVENLDNYKEEKAIFDYFKELINIRKNFNCLENAPVLTLLTDDEKNIYAYSRFLNKNDALIVSVTKQEQQESVIIDISNLPSNEVKKWKNCFNEKTYDNICGKITLEAQDFNESFSVALKAV